MALWLCWGRAQKRNSGLCEHFFLGESCPLSSLPDAGQFSSSPYVSDTFQSSTPCWSSVSLCRALYRELPGIPAVSVFHSLNPHWFLQPEVVETSLPGTGTLGWGPGVGLGSLAPEISLLIFIHHTCVGLPVLYLCISTPPTHLNECDFFNPWLLDFHTAIILKILGNSCFVV